MAITKILNIKESEGRNPASHLKNALEYIKNPDKTEECVLVGGINCLPDTAFEQMEETKNIFHKTGKRQGYHVIISFSPEEKVTAEQAMYVLEHFAKDVLGDDYEAVYAVHTDREHMHGHLIWNSVSMTIGKKYNSPKGNWRNHLQPITNKYCDELGLSIMPAEYSRNPKNISRDKWEREMSMKEIILRDAKMCAYAAGNVEHFKYLMKRLGYVFKKDAWMEVQAPGFRYYHSLAKMDEMFAEDRLRHHVDMPWMAKPYFYSSDIRKLHRAKLSSFQKKFYAKLYRLRIVEQKRFAVGGAKYTEDLKRFHQLQDEYLLIVNNDIKSVVDLVDFIGEQEEKIQQIEDRQHEIYRESSSRKRSIKNEEQYREYQIWHVEVQEELDELKQEKDAGRQEIHLGFSVKSHISPDFLVKFQYEYPQCVIKVWNVGYSEAVTAMQNKSLDAAIFPYMMLESDSMQIIPFYHDPAFSVIELSNLCEVVVEMSEDNPLSKLKEVSIDQLKDETFIMNSKKTGSTSDFYTDTSDPLVRACISRGFYPKASDKIMVIGNDMKTAHMLIVNNYGIALRIVPVTDGAIPGLVRIPLERNTIIVKTFLVFRRESNSKVLNTFSDYMIQQFGGKAVK